LRPGDDEALVVRGALDAVPPLGRQLQLLPEKRDLRIERQPVGVIGI
jgi:hypothetical protein